MPVHVEGFLEFTALRRRSGDEHRDEYDCEHGDGLAFCLASSLNRTFDLDLGNGMASMANVIPGLDGLVVSNTYGGYSRSLLFTHTSFVRDVLSTSCESTAHG